MGELALGATGWGGCSMQYINPELGVMKTDDRYKQVKGIEINEYDLY